ICDEGIDGSLIREVADVLDELLKRVRNRLDPNDLEAMLSVEMTFLAIVGSNMNYTAALFQEGVWVAVYRILKVPPHTSHQPSISRGGDDSLNCCRHGCVLRLMTCNRPTH